MEDVNKIPVTTPELVAQVNAIVKPLFRKGTVCDFVMQAAMSLRGDFDHKDLLNAAKAQALKTPFEVGNLERNCRYVETKLVKLGRITKVRRGRWIVAQ